MIISASRRTDIPNYYSEWFLNRIRDGFLYVRNPVNPHQISDIDLSPGAVDCIVFWTKNPGPMLGRLDELSGYHYYFQFTLTGYGTDIECYVPHKRKVMIPVFKQLSGEIGRQRVIWRYDPILFTHRYTPEYHIKAFGQIAASLEGYTDKCVISFVDLYAKNKKSMSALNSYDLDESRLMAFAEKLAQIGWKHGIEIASCAEKLDLQKYGIRHNCCIDKDLIERITACPIHVLKDKNQRLECGCAESVEIGAYNTCKNGCRYCYANSSGLRVENTCRTYNPHSPLLCGEVGEGDKISKRKVKSVRDQQLSLKFE